MSRPIQISLPLVYTDPVQQRYEAIRELLRHPEVPLKRHALTTGVSYRRLRKYLEQFRQQGMRGLFDAESTTPQPPRLNIPESIQFDILYLKCLAPCATLREIARVACSTFNLEIDRRQVKKILQIHTVWQDTRFQQKYPQPANDYQRRVEIVKLRNKGWNYRSIMHMLGVSKMTVYRVLRRFELHQYAGLVEGSHTRHHQDRVVTLSIISEVLWLQKRFPYAGWFRIQGFMRGDDPETFKPRKPLRLGEGTIKRIMRLNRKLHILPPRPGKDVPEERMNPHKPAYRHQLWYIDLRYIRAKLQGQQLYSILLLEGYSRLVLAGCLTDAQDLSQVLMIFYSACLVFFLPNWMISDNGSVFTSDLYCEINRRLGIYPHHIEKGKPWQNLVEALFSIEHRLADYAFSQCSTMAEMAEQHTAMIRQMNHTQHWAHRHREDGRYTPQHVLGAWRGRPITPPELRRAFFERVLQRQTNTFGFINVHNFHLYIEEGLPKQGVELTIYNNHLKIAHRNQLLAEYECQYDEKKRKLLEIKNPKFYDSPFKSRQLELFARPVTNPVSIIDRVMKPIRRPRVQQLAFNWC